MVTRTKKIFVGGLSAPSTLEDVKKYFEQFGRVSGKQGHFFHLLPKTHTNSYVRLKDSAARIFSCHLCHDWQFSCSLRDQDALPTELPCQWQVTCTLVELEQAWNRARWPELKSWACTYKSKLIAQAFSPWKGIFLCVE